MTVKKKVENVEKTGNLSTYGVFKFLNLDFWFNGENYR